MDRTSNSGFEPFFWPLLYKSQSWFLALDLWTEPQILVLNLSFGLYSTSPRAGFWRWIYGQNLKFGFCTFLLASTLQVPELVSGVGSMDRTSNSGFEPFFWPLRYKSQSWFLALDLWTEPQILVLNLSFGLYSTSPRAGFWRWIYGQNLKFWF